MNAKHAAEKYAHKYCISFPVDADDLKLNAEITDAISKHFISGAAWAREQILELLRSPEAVMAIGFPHALEVATDWLERNMCDE